MSDIFSVDTVGYRIMMLRRMANISRQTLADGTGLSFNVVNNIEYGKHRINIEQIEKVANYFVIPAAVLMPNTIKDQANVYTMLDAAFVTSIIDVFNREREALQYQKDIEAKHSIQAIEIKTEPETTVKDSILEKPCELQ